MEWETGPWADFAKAVRQGISPDGDPYYPTFTYPFYANFTDQDIADLWAAFQTVPAVERASAGPRRPFSVRSTMGDEALESGRFLTEPFTAPEADKSDVWNRGKLLVNGAAHCSACHTTRNCCRCTHCG